MANKHWQMMSGARKNIPCASSRPFPAAKRCYILTSVVGNCFYQVEHSAMILIVDDDAGMGASLERLLRVIGYNAVAIPSAMEALSLLGVRRPELIIVDMHMPGGMDGMMFLRAVRQDDEFAEVPIWVYSVDFSDSLVREAKRSGAQEYLVKGAIGYSALASRVETLLGKPGK